ncbi:MAG: hypothetical protein HC932_04465 [Thermales bacterium]|nr:hypothetical protein [Thermales bacterium]
MFLYLAGFFKKVYTLENIQIIGKGAKVAILDLITADKKALSANAGQYVYLQLNGFGESRPFSILSVEGDKLRLGIKLEGRFTKKVHQLKAGKNVNIFGPLGQFTAEGHNQKDKIIISGGIGITPLIAFAKEYFTPNSIFIVCNRFKEDVVDLDDLKNSVPSKNLFEFYSQEDSITNPHHKACRLDTTKSPNHLS